MKILFSFSALLILVLSLSGCQKVEGPGGSGTIRGKVFIKVYDGANNLINSYYAPKEDVYIIYGGGVENFYDDDIETNMDGLYEFNYLEPGTYTLFVYSKCTTCPSGKEIVSTDVEIKEKGQIVEVTDIEIRK